LGAEAHCWGHHSHDLLAQQEVGVVEGVSLQLWWVLESMLEWQEVGVGTGRLQGLGVGS